VICAHCPRSFSTLLSGTSHRLRPWAAKWVQFWVSRSMPSADNNERGVNRQALTFGISYLFNQNTTLKAEYRLDRASGAVFEDINNGGFKKTNQLVGASVLVSF
jgi:hypothetical protein